MDEIPNVNNLNGISNFGHGLPDNVPAEDVQTVAAAPEGVEIEIPAEMPAEKVDTEEITSEATE